MILLENFVPVNGMKINSFELLYKEKETGYMLVK